MHMNLNQEYINQELQEERSMPVRHTAMRRFAHALAFSQ